MGMTSENVAEAYKITR